MTTTEGRDGGTAIVGARWAAVWLPWEVVRDLDGDADRTTRIDEWNGGYLFHYGGSSDPDLTSSTRRRRTTAPTYAPTPQRPTTRRLRGVAGPTVPGGADPDDNLVAIDWIYDDGSCYARTMSVHEDVGDDEVSSLALGADIAHRAVVRDGRRPRTLSPTRTPTRIVTRQRRGGDGSRRGSRRPLACASAPRKAIW